MPCRRDAPICRPPLPSPAGRLDDDRDRALAAEIATGVERWRALLDHLIEATAARAIDRLDPEIVTILRLSAYQLLYLTRVPAAAVVDDAVELARRVKKRSAAGFVNGVLRSLSRKRSDAADAAAAGRSEPTAPPRSTTSRSRSLIPDGSSRAGSIGSASKPRSAGSSSTTCRRG